jgi:hypothetical protein
MSCGDGHHGTIDVMRVILNQTIRMHGIRLIVKLVSQMFFLKVDEYSREQSCWIALRQHCGFNKFWLLSLLLDIMDELTKNWSIGIRR